MRASYVEFQDVLDAELREIEKRRAQTGLPPLRVDPTGGNETTPPTGLALSGGGPRSACIGLGLLQALYRSGLLRHLDYLSTVSGGGYVGSYLSSWVTAMDGKIEWSPEQKSSEPAPSTTDRAEHKGGENGAAQQGVPLPFYAELNAPQPAAVRRMAGQGEVLRRPIKFLSRHLWGFLLVNAFFLNLVVALGALLAYLVRSLDLESVQVFLNQLGFYGDTRRAFFPAAVMFMTWLISLRIQEVFRRRYIQTPPFSTWAYCGLMVTVLLGTVSLFSLGNLSTESLEITYGVNSQESDQIRWILGWIAKGLLVLLGAAVAPYFSLKALLRSGTAPRWKMEAWVFNLVSYAILAGVPLLVFTWLAQENLSGWNLSMSNPHAYQMSRNHFRDWRQFLSQMVLAANSSEPSQKRHNSPVSVWLNANPSPVPSDRSKNEEQPNAIVKKAIYDRLNTVDLNASEALPKTDNTAMAGSAPPGFWWGLYDRLVLPFVSLNPDQERGQTAFVKLLMLQRERDYVIKNQWLPAYWLAAMGAALRMDDQFGEQLRDQKRLNQWKDRVTEKFNQAVLSDPYFYRELFVLNRPWAAQSEDRSEVNFHPQHPVMDGNSWPTDLPSLQLCLTRAETLARAAQVLPPIHQRSFQNDQGLCKWLLEREKVLNQLRNEARNQFQIRQKAQESKLLEDLIGSAMERDKFSELLRQIRRNNWNLVRAAYYHLEGQDFWYPPEEVFAVVVASHDQTTRLEILGWSLLSLAILGLLFNVNPTLLHAYYRDQLSEQWIEPHPRYGRRLPLAKLQNCAKGAPFHLLSGTHNLFGKSRDVDHAPTGRFSFSQSHIGGERIGYCQTQKYLRGKYELADAMAVSGAAVSPTGLDNVLVRILLLLSNFRLGQWLPTPRRLPGDFSRPTPLGLFGEFLLREPVDRSYLFVCDGGYVDNTGIAPLLQRRCRVMIACDAGQDEAFQFADLRRLLSEGESRYGIQFSPIDPADHRIQLEKISLPLPDPRASTKTNPSGQVWSENSYLIIKVRYPDDELTRRQLGEDRTGYLIYVKPTLTGKEPADLLHYRKTRPEFPHDPTVEMCFDPEQFHMYRRLGERLGDVLIQECFQNIDLRNPLCQWKPDVPAEKQSTDAAAAAAAPVVDTAPAPGDEIEADLGEEPHTGPAPQSNEGETPPPAGVKPVADDEPPSESLSNEAEVDERVPIRELHGRVSEAHLPIIKQILKSQDWLTLINLYHYLNDADGETAGKVRSRKKTLRRTLIQLLKDAFQNAKDDAVRHVILDTMAVVGHDDFDMKSFFEAIAESDQYSKETRQLCSILVEYVGD